MKVLVCLHERVYCPIIDTFLKQQQFEPIVVKKNQALEVAKRENVDAALIGFYIENDHWDIYNKVSDHDGIELARELLKLNAKVLFYSCYETYEVSKIMDEELPDIKHKVNHVYSGNIDNIKNLRWFL